MLPTLYNVEINTINYYIKKIYSYSELTEEATIRKFRIVQKEGNREVARDVVHYNLQMIIVLGFKVDNERLKNSGSILTEKYFDEIIYMIYIFDKDNIKIEFKNV